MVEIKEVNYSEESEGKMSNCCIDCEHYRIGICGLRNIYPYPPDRINCDKFAPNAVKSVVLQDSKWRIIDKKKPTLFDRITASPDMLATKFIGLMFDHRFTSKYRYYSMLTVEFYDSESEAFAATMAKLKEVYNETTSN